MMPFAQFEQQALAIPYQYKHPRFLYGLIRWLRPTSVVEVGTHIGASAVWMARALQENGDGGVLTCIDSFCWRDQPTQQQQWKENVARCGFTFATKYGLSSSSGDLITLLVGRSQEVEWPARVDFAYIDGSHSRRASQQDLDKALGHGATCICMNDIATCMGVRKVAYEFRWAKGDSEWGFIQVPFDAGLLVALKNQPLPEPIQGDDDPWDKP